MMQSPPLASSSSSDVAAKLEKATSVQKKATSVQEKATSVQEKQLLLEALKLQYQTSDDIEDEEEKKAAKKMTRDATNKVQEMMKNYS